MTLDPNDPKLTAYALGELDDAEQAEVEAALRQSPELRRAVDEIRRTAALLSEHLQAEACPPLTAEQREAIFRQSEEPASPAAAAAEKPRRRRRIVLPLAAAASLLLAVGITLYAWPLLRGSRPAAESVAVLVDRSGPPAQMHPGPFASPADVGPVSRAHSDSPDSAGEGPAAQVGVSVSARDDLDVVRRWERLEADSQGQAFPGYAEHLVTKTPPGGVNSAVADGSVPFVSDSITSPTEGQPPDVSFRLDTLMRGSDSALSEPGGEERSFEVHGRSVEESSEGQSLPSPHYMSDDIQYFTPGPEFGTSASHDRRQQTSLPDFDFDVDDDIDRSFMAFGRDGDEGDSEEGEEPPIGYPDPQTWQELGSRRRSDEARQLRTEGQRQANNIESSAQVQSSELAGGEEPPNANPDGRVSQDVLNEQDGTSTTMMVTPRIAIQEEPTSLGRDLDEAGERSGRAGRAGGRPARFEQGGQRPVPVEGKGQRTEVKTGPPQTTTWRRAKATPNASRLMIGDRKDLPLEGMQANVTIDGFRARVLLDYYFYNDGDRQYEGTFKLRLPNGASLYFFAFGESAYRYRPQEKKDVRGAFLTVSHSRSTGHLPDEILKLRADSWNAPKVARVVPKEKAAFAYRQTVRRRVDPALVEWSGAGIFSARVFPLAPQKLHRIVVGYDVDLVPAGGDLEYRLDLPEVAECTVDVSLAAWAGGSARITPDVRPFMSNGRAYYTIADPQERQIRVRLEDPGTVLLIGADEGTGDYFATRLRPELPDDETGTSSSTAVFLLDTSLSSNPDRFNVWLKLLGATLDGNRDAIRRFAVLTFNVEAHWWQEEFVDNTPENVQKLLDYANTLALEGATDLGRALREAASPGWLAAEDESEPWDVFLLSDGALNWGETNVYSLTETFKNDSSHAGALFAYQTAMAGTEGRVLEHLARETGGAVFAVVGEAQIERACRAHRKRPWQVAGVELEGSRDLLLAGRPKTIFPGQELLLVGRGRPAPDARIVLTLRRGGQNKKVRIKPDRVVQSELAPRVYGQVAVGQLESLGSATEDLSVSYARHFRVTGQTCSLLMLESEADYQRFDIKAEDDAFVVSSSLAADAVARALDQFHKLLVDPKAAFQAWLARLEKMPGLNFNVSPALNVAIDSLPTSAFSVRPRPLRCKHRTWTGISSELKEDLSTGRVEYEAILAEADRRLRKYGESDALRVFSSLVEHSPGDLALVRDVAYSAMAWDLDDQAYHLLRRVAMSRPYEPQMYLAMAQSLAKTGHRDLAILYYEVALGGKWDNRFQEFHRIASVDYLHFLRQITGGKGKTRLEQFAKARLDRIGREWGPDKADLVVTILWNTDGTDVDLHVFEPTGEVCNYQNRSTKIGGQLTPDCTQGFGPEMYVLLEARPGKYDVKVKYYASDRNRAGTRTKVYAAIYEGWGTKQERAVRKALVLSEDKELTEVAAVGIEK